MNTTPDYCTQNGGACLTCSLANYGRDCVNNKIHTLGSLAGIIAGGNLEFMAKLLNDYGGMALNELAPDPGAHVPRPALMALYAQRAGDRVGHKTAQALAE